MKSKHCRIIATASAEEQASSKMELSTDQPVVHPEACGESGANGGVNLSII
jgi:hypothetical protein